MSFHPTLIQIKASDQPQDQLESWPPNDETVRCPYSYFDGLRETSPVYRFPTPSPEGVHTWAVTSWEACAAVLTNAKAFVNELSGVLPPWEANQEPRPRPEVPTFYDDPNIFFSDGDDHKVKRNWAMRLFERQRLEAAKEVILEETDSLIDAFIGDGRFNVRTQFTDVMPMRVVRKVMGLPEEVDPRVKRLSMAIATNDSNPNQTADQVTELHAAFMSLMDLVVGELEDRVDNPRDDYVTALVQKQMERDGTLDVNALAKHCAVVIFGADHAVGGHLADIISRLAIDPALQASVREDRSRIDQLAYEVLRRESPVPWLFRKCVVDTEVCGVTIPAGSLVLVSTLAGNHDPAEWPQPYAYDLGRPNVQRNHLSLGRGAHRCVGAPLAKLFVDIMVNRLLDRMSEIRIDEQSTDLLPELSYGFRVPTTVHCTFAAATPA